MRKVMEGVECGMVQCRYRGKPKRYKPRDCGGRPVPFATVRKAIHQLYPSARTAKGAVYWACGGQWYSASLEQTGFVCIQEIRETGLPSAPQLGRRLRTKPMVPEVAAVMEAYNAIAGDGLRAERGYIVPSKWPAHGNARYEVTFREEQLCLVIRLDANNLFLKTLCLMLTHAVSKATVAWKGRDGLHMKFPKDTEPAVVAEAMKRLIELTSPVISEELVRRATQ